MLILDIFSAFHECVGAAIQMLYPLLLPAALWLFSISLWNYYINNLRDKTSDLPIPPGTVGLPFIGETIQMVTQGWQFYKTRREMHGHIYKTHILGRPTIRVWGTANIQQILKNEERLLTMSWPTSSLEIIGRGSLMASTRRDHNNRRALIAKAFTTKAVQGYSVKTAPIVKNWVLNCCEKQDVIKALHETRLLGFEASAAVLLGTDIAKEQMTRLMNSIDIMVANFFTLSVDVPGTGFHQAMVARREFLSIIRDVIKKKRRSEIQGENDTLSFLLEAVAAGDLSQNEAEDSLIESFFSSQNGIPSLCCSTLVHLAKHPKVVSKLYEELSDAGLLDSEANLTLEDMTVLPYLEQVWKEITRIAPPFGGGFRQVIKTFELEGYQIPAGWTVLYSIRDNHDAEENFDSHSDFNPDRWCDVKSNASWLPFGGNGIRSCVGQRYTTTFLRQFISSLVKYSQWEIHDANPGFNAFPVLLPNAQLPVVFHHRKPTN